MPRRPRFHTECRMHHITTRGNNRRSMFEDADDRERFYDLLDTGIATNHVECHQDVQMGNHVEGAWIQAFGEGIIEQEGRHAQHAHVGNVLLAVALQRA